MSSVTVKLPNYTIIAFTDACTCEKICYALIEITDVKT